ncbi:twin-arginine translocation signal domain-containing protein, partial [Streptomyces griseoruber]
LSRRGFVGIAAGVGAAGLLGGPLVQPANASAHPLGPVRPRYRQGNQNVWEDSVLPVHQAGQVKLWEGSYTLDSHLTLHPAPGHTPGSSVIQLKSGSDRAV